ncbi:MAG: universal stress protein [Flavobacteriaceae bacterium]|nr:universal stress protein [Flavobacteriaceae bacterium]
MKKILVPTDFSDNAWDALMYAIRLYDDIPARFYILNTYLVGASRVSNIKNKARNTHIFQYAKKESESELKKINTYLKENLLNDKHKFETISKSGSFFSIVKHLVSSENMDMIIMGTTGASGAKEIFMGSNTVKMIKSIDLCPIISVPKDYQYEEPEVVVFATDFKRHFSAIELNCLIELQIIHNFTLRVIHVKKETTLNKTQQLNKDALIKCFNAVKIIFEEIESDSNVSSAINNYTEKLHTQLVCLVNYEHSFIEQLTHEPIIKKVSFHSSVPLLILPV